jgi:hypothetical protein
LIGIPEPLAIEWSDTDAESVGPSGRPLADARNCGKEVTR